MRIWTLLLLSLVTCSLLGQNVFVTKQKILDELEARGLEVDEVEQVLKEKGIELEYLDETTISPEQIEAIQLTILELEAAKQINFEEDENELVDSLETDEIELDSLELLEPEEIEEFIPEIYGQQLFHNDILKLTTSSEEIKAPDSYILGPGDYLVVSVWGRSHFDNEYQIDDNGYIKTFKGAKRVYLKGLSLGQAKKKLYSNFRENYIFGPGEFHVDLNFSRTVRVSIYGEVANAQGTFAIPAFNSAFYALSAVGGANEIGSLRNIKLQKASGQSKTMDVYDFMKDPSIANEFYLDDNDVILIPVAEKVVAIEGGIKRPLKYELTQNEGLKELIEFAGGFTENAFLKKIQIQRSSDDKKQLIDINWREELRKGGRVELNHGDVVLVEEIERAYENFVEVSGAVDKPGQFQRELNMRISDVLDKAGLTSESNTEIVYLERMSPDSTLLYKRLNLNQILQDKSHPDNILLQNRDKIEIWPQSRFSDQLNLAVDGAVRYPGVFSYNANKSISVKDAILLAGGLRRDASNYAIIHRNDPLNPKIKLYKTIPNLDVIFENPSLETNYELNPFDSLVVKSNNTFLEETYVRIEGAINNPGEYQYGLGMTIKDLMVLAGGFKMAASTNNIEISRVIIKNNEPTRTVVANLEMDREYNLGGELKNSVYKLEPFDNIAVRFIKDFELQKRVFLEGEVQYPGPYAISKENEKILSIISRAGGLTDEAFPAGATLMRDDQEYGSVVIKLEEIIDNPSSEFNFFVKNGDRIFVPKIKEFVTIKGATRAREVVGKDKINEGNAIHVPFHQGKDAMFYINEYAGGLHENADKQKIFVEHANGEIKRPRNGFLVKRFPKVFKGSVITVGFKSFEKNEDDKESNVDWTKVLGDSVAQAMSILTLIVLVSRLN